MRGLMAIVLGLSLALAAAPRPAMAGPVLPRVELPIRAVILSDGARRYGVTLRIAGRLVETGLDSGSTGLRILPRGLPAAAAEQKGPVARYGYESGTRFTGHAIDVPVAVEGVPDQNIRVQRIDIVDCFETKPDCGGNRARGDAFGIQGDGLSGEGFAAILGVGLKSDSVPNPLIALGARRWIIELPRPGDTAPGRLILNPTDAEVASYRRVALIGDDGNRVPGCLALAAPNQSVCGDARLDTGAPGLRVVDAAAHSGVATGAAAQLVIGEGDARTVIDIQIGRRDQASRMEFDRRIDARQPQLYFGIAPYFFWSVLYDPSARAIGLKPR
jgi:hypothetical protein